MEPMPHQAFVVDRGVEVFLGNHTAGRTAGLCRFKLFAAADASADVINDFAERGSHRDFDQSGVVDFTGQGEHLGSLGGFRADGAEPGGALQDDHRNVGPRFNVVDDGRLAPQAFDGREGRTRNRHAALAFDRGEQGGFFAADKCAGAETELDVRS